VLIDTACVPADILGESFRGYLQTDGYSGYHAVCGRDGVSGVGCMAHVRRKFVDAAKVHKHRGLAHEAVAMIRQLYAVEKLAKTQAENGKDFSFDDRKALRLEKAKPVLDTFKQWLDQHKDEVVPKSAIGKAMAYARNEWSRLIVYLEDGRIEIDNNGAERSIKPFVIGRKNWLFCNTASGAAASAPSRFHCCCWRYNGVASINLEISTCANKDAVAKLLGVACGAGLACLGAHSHVLQPYLGRS